ncbi:MAG: addiction module antidote protein HigA family [Verrucomicrobiota bacterium]|jgi:addiction module HigA family antidote
MKSKPPAIPRDPLKVPNPQSNPAAALIRDTLDHHGLTQAAAAAAMKISPAQLNDILREKKGVSASIALRFQACFGTPGDFLIRLQAQYDFQKAYHTKGPQILRECASLV